MKKATRSILIICCVLSMAFLSVSCGGGKAPGEETLRADFEKYLSYGGTLPFTYILDEFTIDETANDSKNNTCAVTVSTKVDTKYGDELYSAIQYTAALNYVKISGEWMLQYVAVISSNVETGFEMGAVFKDTYWEIDMENSQFDAKEMRTEGVPVSFNFAKQWQDDSFTVETCLYVIDETESSSSTNKLETEIKKWDGIFISMGAYSSKYTTTCEWDFKLSFYVTGGIVDFLHISGSLNSVENWVVGYRFSDTGLKCVGIYDMQEPAA